MEPNRVCNSILQPISHEVNQLKKISIRFFDDREVRAIWDDDGSKWWFSVIDIVGVLSQSSDSRNYMMLPSLPLILAVVEVLAHKPQLSTAKAPLGKDSDIATSSEP